ncbi:MAG: hypothetical protein HY540_06210 [Deltaproteobacteria bacterium]|nr:hypothetical protein [Deltaproteobacteria bacterium]
MSMAAAKAKHPYDKYDHEMHNSFFESAEVSCEMCHADPDSYGNRKKVNRLGCHRCHNDPAPILPANPDCMLCHEAGIPKPQNHKTRWIAKHGSISKQAPETCKQCHPSTMFCMDCHKRRDTVQERMHTRNFRFYHSVEARANPRKCDSCHRVSFCQDCHAGKETSGR